MEFMIAVTMLLTMFNFIMLYRLLSKRQLPSADTIALYEEQIKHLKKISRLNEKYIKAIKEKEEPKHEQNVVRTEEQRRIY
jgi:hypothetical protein